MANTEHTPNWIKKLQLRWDVSAWQVIVILIVFAFTGFTVMFLKKPIVAYFVGSGEQSIVFTIAYYILILPVYNLFLLVYGFLFGQFKFFWAFEKKTLGRITKWFKSKK